MSKQAIGATSEPQVVQLRFDLQRTVDLVNDEYSSSEPSHTSGNKYLDAAELCSVVYQQQSRLLDEYLQEKKNQGYQQDCYFDTNIRAPFLDNGNQNTVWMTGPITVLLAKGGKWRGLRMLLEKFPRIELELCDDDGKDIFCHAAEQDVGDNPMRDACTKILLQRGYSYIGKNDLLKYKFQQLTQSGSIQERTNSKDINRQGQDDYQAGRGQGNYQPGRGQGYQSGRGQGNYYAGRGQGNYQPGRGQGNYYAGRGQGNYQPGRGQNNYYEQQDNYSGGRGQNNYYGGQDNYTGGRGQNNYYGGQESQYGGRRGRGYGRGPPPRSYAYNPSYNY